MGRCARELKQATLDEGDSSAALTLRIHDARFLQPMRKASSGSDLHSSWRDAGHIPADCQRALNESLGEVLQAVQLAAEAPPQ